VIIVSGPLMAELEKTGKMARTHAIAAVIEDTANQ
jgi:hypothetical protein